MSNYYLCDTCSVFHTGCGEGRIYCHATLRCFERLIISELQTPREVCLYWKPKEA